MQDAPFFTVKLNVKVLPCLIMFSGGVAADRVAGFDDFGAKDSFTTDSGKGKYTTGVTWLATVSSVLLYAGTKKTHFYG